MSNQFMYRTLDLENYSILALNVMGARKHVDLNTACENVH